MFAKVYLGNRIFSILGCNRAFKFGAELELFLKGQNKKSIQFDILEFSSFILALYLLVL